MSTFEAPAVDAALLRRINEDLRIALREAGAILAKQGRSPAEAWEATQPFLPLMVLLRSLLEGPAARSPIRTALIRLLWRDVADGGGCVCEEGATIDAGAWDQRVTDTCQAMRALGWGEHWDAEAFQRKAMIEQGNAPTGAPSPSLPDAEQIESAYVERQPLHVCKVLPLKAAGAASPNGPQEKP